MERADADLAVAARSGDREAFAAIYDRYADPIHDFCFGILRDRDEAADATHDTFVVAAERLDGLRDPAKLRAWLFAVARHEAIRRGRARARVVRAEPEELNVVPSAEPGPEDAVARDELAALVWRAAGGLEERDRVVMELSVRRGLDTDEIAEAIGVKPAHASVLVNRMRDRVERGIGAVLVAREGGRDCPKLAAVLREWDGTLTPAWRASITRHAESCDACGRTRKRVLSPLALLSAMALVGAPVALRGRVLDDAAMVGAQRTAREPGWRRDGFPPPMDRPARRRLAVAAAILVLGSLPWTIPLLLNAQPQSMPRSGATPPLGAIEATEAQRSSGVSPAGSTTATPPTRSTRAGSVGAPPPSSASGNRPPSSPSPSSTPSPSPSPSPSPAPDFRVSCSPGSMSVPVGGSGTSACTATSTGGFTAAVSFSCTGVPAGTSCGFSPSSATPPPDGSATTTLTVSVGTSTPPGSYSFKVVARGGGRTRTFLMRLTVTSR